MAKMSHNSSEPEAGRIEASIVALLVVLSAPPSVWLRTSKTD
jgi:hypothetical protein